MQSNTDSTNEMNSNKTNDSKVDDAALGIVSTKEGSEENASKGTLDDKEARENELSHTCPINQSGLMVNPVVAEDGFTYEDSAIKEYFEANKQMGREIRSPITRKVMGTTTIPNRIAKQDIENLVEKNLFRKKQLWNGASKRRKLDAVSNWKAKPRTS